MKALFCLALTVVGSFAVDVRKSQTMFAQTNSKIASAMNEIKANPFGELIMNLAEIHMATAGPLEDLKQALADLETATGTALTTEAIQFQSAANTHKTEVAKWKALIASAQSDIASTEASLNNILYPRKAQLEEAIANLHHDIDSNIATTEKETQDRHDAHEEFLVKENEYTLAIEAAHEALTLLQQLRNGEVSLAQVRVAQNSLKKVQEKVSKLHNNKYATFIKALTQIAQNFSDQEVLGRVINLVNDLLANCEEGLEQIRAAEADATNTWETIRLPQLQAELASLQGSLQENEDALTSTINDISTNEHFLAVRKADLESHTGSLAAENANWDATLQAHRATVQRLTTELKGVKDAEAFVDSREFSQYFNENVNQL